MRVGIHAAVVSMTMASALSGCQQTEGPEDVALAEKASSIPRQVAINDIANTTGITHLLIATVEVGVLGGTDDPIAVAEILSLLTETERSTLTQRRLVHVVDPDLAAEIAAIVGINMSDPAVAADGLLVTSYIATTWGQIKCCYKDPKCCPKKKKEQ